MKMKLFEKPVLENQLARKISSDKFGFETKNYQSENKSLAFFIEVSKTKANGIAIRCIYCNNEGKEYENSLSNNMDTRALTIFNELKKAAENGFETFINTLKNLDFEDSSDNFCAQRAAECIEKTISRQEQLQLESKPDDDFCFQSANFQSENKAYAYYIGVKIYKKNEVMFTCTIHDEDGNKISSSHISRHPKIMSVYNDLKCAADMGFDSFINALRAVTIDDKKLLVFIKNDVENIEENILLQNKFCGLTY